MEALLDPPAKLSVSPHVLSAIRTSECNLAVWERQGDPSFAALLANHPDDVRFAAPLAGLETQLKSELEEAGYPRTAECTALVADIVDLAKRYAGIMKLDAVSVRLAVVTTNSCRKFHGDYVQARLITTYVGTGTQWIASDDVNRVARGEQLQRIHTLSAGDVGLFKGKMWTQNPAIHRSPPIEGTGEARLILVLDPPRHP